MKPSFPTMFTPSLYQHRGGNKKHYTTQLIQLPDRIWHKLVSSGIFWYQLLISSKFIFSFKPVFALLRLFFILWWDVCIYLLASAVTLFVKNDSSILFIFFLDIWNIFWTTKKSPDPEGPGRVCDIFSSEVQTLFKSTISPLLFQ